jgi:hypothetical protein
MVAAARAASAGAERASLDGLAAVRPARAQVVMVQLALRDSVSGRSSSGDNLPQSIFKLSTVVLRNLLSILTIKKVNILI